MTEVMSEKHVCTLGHIFFLEKPCALTEKPLLPQ